jgi:hypothetical protein
MDEKIEEKFSNHIHCEESFRHIFFVLVPILFILTLWSGEKRVMAGRGHTRCGGVQLVTGVSGTRAAQAGGAEEPPGGQVSVKANDELSIKRQKKKSKWRTVRLFVVHLPLPCQYHANP